MTFIELGEVLKKYGLECDSTSLHLLESYMHYVLKKNEEINLTAIKDEDEFMMRMIVDSALPLRLTDFNNKKVLDIGTGAGYPGTVIATLTTADVDLLDSTEKKLNVIIGFEGKQFNVIHARAEEFAQGHRETYDIVTARAVAQLSILLELAIPLLKVNGYFVALKGPEAEEEIKASKNALKKLHAVIEKMDKVTLPTGEERINILIKKIDTTNMKYPRSYSEIKKKPL